MVQPPLGVRLPLSLPSCKCQILKTTVDSVSAVTLVPVFIDEKGLVKLGDASPPQATVLHDRTQLSFPFCKCQILKTTVDRMSAVTLVPVFIEEKGLVKLGDASLRKLRSA
jgi:hypothetical protein